MMLILAGLLFLPAAASEPSEGVVTCAQTIKDRNRLMKSLFEQAQSSKTLSQRWSKEMQDLLDVSAEAEVWAENLALLEGRYGELSAPELEAEHSRVIEKIGSLERLAKERHAAFDAHMQKEYLTQMKDLVGKRGSDSSAPALTDIQTFETAARDIRAKMRDLPAHDGGVYRQALRARERRRRLLLFGISLAVLLAPVLGLLAWRCRAAARAQRTVLGGNFEVKRELGQGGMGTVYEAEDLTLRRKVAIKQMREELQQSPKDLEMFLNEARLVAALKHPNIVEIHGVLRDDGRVYLVFEHVSGRTLGDLLKESGKMPVRAALALFKPVADAVDYAHACRIIHRDLKPANIMLTDAKAVKVMDFGLAHQASVTVARLTRAAAWGTMAYMAPEQELGSVSRESDVYSLGVCLYEAMAGKQPFPGPDFLRQKRSKAYEPPSKLGLPAGLDAVMARALDPEPGRRFHSAGELLAEASEAL
ncbi:MAG: serine/threonine-protein kinase [Elusimicrobiota bacterium]